MTLVDTRKSNDTYAKLGQTVAVSGGSAANSAAGITSLGGTAAFIGRVKDDDLGRVFKHDLAGVGVTFRSPMTAAGAATGKCLVLVTPDAERTMLTDLGASHELAMNAIDMDLIRNSDVTFIEGYMWDDANTIYVLKRIIEATKQAGKKFAFALSDPFCVNRHKQDFIELLSQVDILFANAQEAKMLFDEDLPETMQRLKSRVPVVAITNGKDGAYVVANQQITNVPTNLVTNVVDTTGAGDMFVAGFLYGFTRGMSLDKCASLGNAAAGEIIQHRGARPPRPLKALIA